MYRIVLLVLATARLIRLVTEDDLGYWWVLRPVKRWATRHEHVVTEDPDPEPDPEDGWRSKLASGIDCMYCVGFHIGWLVLLGEWLTGTKPFRWARPLWTGVLAALGLNMVTTTILRGSARL